MKKLLFIIMLLPVALYGQKLQLVDGVYEMQKVLEFDSVPKNVLFSKAKEWVALKYTSANDVIQNSDPEAGNIVVKGNFKTVDLGMAMQVPRIIHTIIIDVKDGKVRIRINSLRLTCFNCAGAEYPFEGYSGSMSGIVNKKIKQVFAPAEIQCSTMIKSLEDHIRHYTMKKGNW